MNKNIHEKKQNCFLTNILKNIDKWEHKDLYKKWLFY